MIEVDPSDAVPLYLQICRQIRRMVIIGALKPGDRIPAVRELASRTRVNRNTAARAIQHLEQQGVVRTEVGRGTFVAPGDADVRRADREAEIDAWIGRFLRQARDLGLDASELRRRIDSKLDGFPAPNPEETR
jgi:GntR family transcriptional regulator